MPGYIQKVLQKLQHLPPKHPQYSPHECVTTKWTQKGTRQYVMQEDTSPLLPQKEIKYVQSAIGSLLYYGRALDCSILPALSQIATRQATPTIKT